MRSSVNSFAELVKNWYITCEPAHCIVRKSDPKKYRWRNWLASMPGTSLTNIQTRTEPMMHRSLLALMLLIVFTACDEQPPEPPATDLSSSEDDRPDIEVEYNAIISPDNPDDYCSDGVCAMETPFDLGNIETGATASAVIILRNTATCESVSEQRDCAACALKIGSDNNEQAGLRFREGTNSNGRFGLEGAFGAAFDIPRPDASCNQTGEHQVTVTFTAPEVGGRFETSLLIESDDPDEGLIEITVLASVEALPVALPAVQLCVPEDGVLDECSNGDTIEPLERIYLTGESSYDPSGGIIVAYHWEIVEAPAGLDPQDFDWSGTNSEQASFFLPIAGEYLVRLTVTNDSGVESSDVETARVVVNAIPSARLHVQLLWDHVATDQDLHLVNVSAGGKFCSGSLDCYNFNCTSNFNILQWFETDLPGEGPNPSLMRDDREGIGPETINIDTPNPGIYRIFVHYYPNFMNDSEPTRNTLRVYLDGVVAFEASRVLLEAESVWAVADVNWLADPDTSGRGEVTPYPSDGEGMTGSVALRDPSTSRCASEGWDFPNE